MSAEEGKNITNTLPAVSRPEDVVDADLEGVDDDDYSMKDLKMILDTHHDAAGVCQVTAVVQSSLNFVSAVERLLDRASQSGAARNCLGEFD